MRWDWTQELKAYRFPTATLAFSAWWGFCSLFKKKKTGKNHPAPLWFLSICFLLRDDFLRVSQSHPTKAAVPAANDIKYMTGGFHYFPAVLLQWFRISLRFVREVTRELINGQYYISRAANISTLFRLEGDGKRRERTTIRQQLLISKTHRLAMF